MDRSVRYNDAMALPLSRSQIERLGERLVAGDRPEPEDVAQLNDLLLAYRQVLTQAVERVESATALRPSSRVKTRGTTIEKLRRQGGSWLKSMHDLAGMRLVVLDRAAQDQVVARLVAEFVDGRRRPEVIDRRKYPSHGYRAVHVVVHPDGAQVEIQVRTILQHEWAELFEKLADRVGRGIRYGEPVADDRVADAREAQKLVAQALAISDAFDAFEQELVPPDSLVGIGVLAVAGFSHSQLLRRIDALGPPDGEAPRG